MRKKTQTKRRRRSSVVEIMWRRRRRWRRVRSTTAVDYSPTWSLIVLCWPLERGFRGSSRFLSRNESSSYPRPEKREAGVPVKIDV